MTLYVRSTTWKTVSGLYVYAGGWRQVARLYVATPDTSVSPPGTIWKLVETFVAPSAAGETVNTTQLSFGVAQVRLSVTGVSSDSHDNFQRVWEIYVNGSYHDETATGPGGLAQVDYSSGLAIGNAVKARCRYRSSSGSYGAYSAFSAEIILV